MYCMCYSALRMLYLKGCKHNVCMAYYVWKVYLDPGNHLLKMNRLEMVNYSISRRLQKSYLHL